MTQPILPETPAQELERLADLMSPELVRLLWCACNSAETNHAPVLAAALLPLAQQHERERHAREMARRREAYQALGCSEDQPLTAEQLRDYQAHPNITWAEVERAR